MPLCTTSRFLAIQANDRLPSTVYRTEQLLQYTLFGPTLRYDFQIPMKLRNHHIIPHHISVRHPI